MLEQFIFITKKRFFANDLSIIGYSVFLIIILVGAYELLRIIGRQFSLFSCVERYIYYPFIFTFLGFGISLMLALKLNTKKIETGEEFLMHLIEHISSFEKEQEIFIITPNINIGTGKQKENAAKQRKDKRIVPFSEIIRDNPHVTFTFICMTIDKNYIAKYTNTEEKDKIEFFQKGKCNNSAMLVYLYDRYYDKYIHTLDKMIEELNEIINYSNVKFKPCKKDFIEYPIVGYLSKEECVLGKFSDIQSQKGNVRIKGERISSQEFIDLVEKHLLTSFMD
jgi:hypothetical protein